VVKGVVIHWWDKRRTVVAVTATALHRTIARTIVTSLIYRWLYFRHNRLPIHGGLQSNAISCRL